MKRYPDAVAGEWFRPRRTGFKQMCCDCSLIHKWKFRINDGHIEASVARDERATSAARRKLKREMGITEK